MLGIEIKFDEYTQANLSYIVHKLTALDCNSASASPSPSPSEEYSSCATLLFSCNSGINNRINCFNNMSRQEVQNLSLEDKCSYKRDLTKIERETKLVHTTRPFRSDSWKWDLDSPFPRTIFAPSPGVSTVPTASSSTKTALMQSLPVLFSGIYGPEWNKQLKRKQVQSIRCVLA